MYWLFLSWAWPMCSVKEFFLIHINHEDGIKYKEGAGDFMTNSALPYIYLT